MRLIEEQKSVRLQVISLCGLILTTILLQIATIGIDQVDHKITFKALGIVVTAEKRLIHKLNQQFLSLKTVLPFDDIKFHEDYWSSDNPSDEARQIKEQSEQGELDTKECLDAMAEYSRKQSNAMRIELNERSKDLTSLLSQKSCWKPLRGILFTVQIFAVCVLITGYGDLLRTVSKRASKDNAKS